MRVLILSFFLFSEFAIAEKAPTSGSLLWRISGNGLHQSSYLYGTMHTRDRRAFHFSDSVLHCFMRCKSFAMELKLDDLNSETVISSMMMDSGKTIENYLSRNQYDSLQQKTQSATGFPLSLFERMKPIYLATMLSNNELLNDTSSENPNACFLDEYFELLAKRSGKKVYALEMLQTQLDVFNFLSIEEQIVMLMKSIREGNNKSEVDTFIMHYINGELEVLINNKENELWPADFVNQILYQRNKGMADNIESLIVTHSTFAAFGAAHLTGDSGIISLLRKRGFNVEPVDAYYNDISEEGWLYVYPCSVIAVPMPGFPQFSYDTLPTSNLIYQKWTSMQSNNYVVAHFDKSVSINKKVLEEFAQNELTNQANLSRTKNEFVSHRNVKTFSLTEKSANGNAFIIENGNEKIAVLVLKDDSLNEKELIRFFSLIRYKISSVFSY